MLAIGDLLKSLLEFFLKPKNILALGVAAVLAYGGFQLYNYVYDRGAQHQAAEDAKLIKAANDARDKAIREKAEYVAAFDVWKRTSDNLTEAMRKTHEAEMQRQQQRLVDAERSYNKRIKDLQNAIPHFIPPDADPVLSVGFICLHNLSYEANTPAGDSPLPARGCENVRASSGIRLSEYADVAVGNVGKALSDRRKLVEFQQWYIDRKAEVDAAIEQQKAAAPSQQ